MIEDLKPYPEYKDSGLPWLGSIPSNWKVRRIKSILRESDARTMSGSETLLSLTRTRGLITHRERTEKVHSAKSLIGYKRYYPGQIVMNRMQAWSGMFGAAKFDGLVSPDYAIFEVLGGNSSQFVLERLKSPDLVSQFALASKGIGSGFNRLYTDRFGPIQLTIPPSSEQAAIVKYLGWANGRLDQTIHAKKKIIALLNEQKQVIINQAVTRGLDADVKFKPSGVEWIGDIPENWEARRIRACIQNYIAGIWGEEPDSKNKDEHIVCIRVADFDIRNLSISQSHLTLRAVPQNAQKTRKLKSGDILMEKSGGGDAEPVGRVVYFDVDFPAVTSNFVTRIRPDSSVVISRFLLFVLANLQATRRNVPSIKQTTGIQNLDERHYLSNYLGLPSLDEQKYIVEYIDTKSAEIDSTISRTQREINLLNEFRTRLISDVVTGKLDVREVAAALPDETLPETEIDEMVPSDDELLEEALSMEEEES